MGKYWSAFELEFKRLASGKSDRAKELLEGLEEHVLASMADQSPEVPEDERERIAVSRLGTPRSILQADIDLSRRQWLPVWLALAGLTWCAAWMIVGSREWSMQMVAPVLGLTPFAVFVGSLFSRRLKLWALAGVTAGVGVTMMAIVCLTWLNLRMSGGMGYVPKWEVTSAIAMVNLEIENQDSVIRGLQVQRAAFARGDKVAARASGAYSRSRGWQVPTRFWIGYRQPQFDYVVDFGRAQVEWKKHSGHLIQTLEDMKMDVARSRDAMQDARSYAPLETLKDNLPSFIGVAVSGYLILASAHLLGLTLVALGASMDRRRWQSSLRA